MWRHLSERLLRYLPVVLLVAVALAIAIHYARPLPPRTPRGGAADRLAGALDELYGTGHGEGSGIGPDSRGGRGAAFPRVPEWAGGTAPAVGPGGPRGGTGAPRPPGVGGGSAGWSFVLAAVPPPR